MKIDGLGLQQLINVKGLNDILGKLPIGEKLEVQVVQISGNEIVLRLPNGQNVSAATTAPLELNLGDFINISVKSKSDNQIVFQTLADVNEQTKFNDVGDTLMALKLPPDERNFEIGKALINQHLSLNKDNFNSVVKVLGMFEGIDIEKAVFIAANNISSIPEGNELLKKFESNEVSVGKSIGELASLLNLSSSNGKIDNKSSSTEKLKLYDFLKDSNKELKSVINNYVGSETDDSDVIGIFIKQSIAQSDNIESTIEALMNRQISSGKLGHLLQIEDNKQLFQLIAQNPKLEERLIDFLNNKESVSNFLLNFSKEKPEIMAKYINAYSSNTVEIIKNSLKDIVNIIKDGRIKKEINVNKLYNDLETTLDALEKHLSKFTVQNSDKIEGTIKEIRTEINFVKNIDNMFNFYQLPFVINKNSTTVDMYILKNNREHKIINPENATLFLSLNTHNLGQVEVLIQIQGKTANLNFRLQDDKTIGFFEKKQDMLENILANKGYSTGKIKFILSSKRTNLVNFEHAVREDKKVVKDVFDMKV